MLTGGEEDARRVLAVKNQVIKKNSRGLNSWTLCMSADDDIRSILRNSTAFGSESSEKRKSFK